MSDSSEPAPEAHGVHGSQRDDGKMQEEPTDTDGGDEEAWADATDTGGDAT
ncbi:MAG TPA: hypothetical protein VHT97_12270 [Acidimicrobiales bacterium]|nr:hypothetical protein [Acidimicrobiales bacterium]